jgi:prefoldin beta subunit
MENIDNETKKKISKLQMLEQKLQSMAMQKQMFQTQSMESENALKEIDSSNDTYKVIGNVMISVDKTKLKEELLSKKEMGNIKVDNLEKEEKKLREEATELQKEVMESMKNE